MSVSAYTLGIVRGSGFVSCLELKIRIKSFSCITKKIKQEKKSEQSLEEPESEVMY